jgi:hypothetical protein
MPWRWAMGAVRSIRHGYRDGLTRLYGPGLVASFSARSALIGGLHFVTLQPKGCPPGFSDVVYVGPKAAEVG